MPFQMSGSQDPVACCTHALSGSQESGEAECEREGGECTPTITEMQIEEDERVFENSAKPGNSPETALHKRSCHEAFMENAQKNDSEEITTKKSKISIPDFPSGGCNETDGVEKSQKVFTSGAKSNYLDEEIEQRYLLPRTWKLNVLSEVLSCPEELHFDKLPESLKENLINIVQFIQRPLSKPCSFLEIWHEVSKKFKLEVKCNVKYIYESSIKIDGILISKYRGLSKKDSRNNACTLLIQRIMFLSTQKRDRNSRKPLCSGVVPPPMCSTDFKKFDQFRSGTCTSGCDNTLGITQEVPSPESSSTEVAQSSFVQKSDSVQFGNSDPQVVELHTVLRNIIGDLNHIFDFIEHYSHCSALHILQMMSEKFGIPLSHHWQNVKQSTLEIDGALISKGYGITQKSAKCMAHRLAIERLLQLAPGMGNSNFELDKPCVFDCCTKLCAQNQSDQEVNEMNMLESGSTESLVKKKRTSKLCDLRKENGVRVKVFSAAALAQKNMCESSKKKRWKCTVLQASEVVPSESSSEKVPNFNLSSTVEGDIQQDSVKDTMPSRDCSIKNVFPLGTVHENLVDEAGQNSLQNDVQKSGDNSAEIYSEDVPSRDLLNFISSCLKQVHPNAVSEGNCDPEICDFNMLPKNFKNNMGPILQFIQAPSNRASSFENNWKKASAIFNFRVDYNLSIINVCSLKADNIILSKGTGKTEKEACRNARRSLIENLVWLSSKVRNMSSSDEKYGQMCANSFIPDSCIPDNSESCVDSVNRFDSMSHGRQFLISPKNSNSTLEQHSLLTIMRKSNVAFTRIADKFNELPTDLKKNFTDIFQYIQNSIDKQLDASSIISCMSEKFKLQVEYHVQRIRECSFEIDGIPISKVSGLKKKRRSKHVASDLAIDRLIQLSERVNSDVMPCLSNSTEIFADEKLIPEITRSSPVDVCKTDMSEVCASQETPKHKILSENLKNKTELQSLPQRVTQKSDDLYVESNKLNVHTSDSFPKSLKINCLNICQFIQNLLSEQVPVVKVFQEVSTNFGLKVESNFKIDLQAEIPHECFLKVDDVVIGIGKGFSGKDAQDEAIRSAIDRLIKLSSDVLKMCSKHLHKNCSSSFGSTFVKKKFVAASHNAYLEDNCKNNLQNWAMSASDHSTISSSDKNKFVGNEGNSYQKSSDRDELKQNFSESESENLVLNKEGKISCSVSNKANESECENFDHVKLSLNFPVILDFSDVTKTNRFADTLSNTASFNHMKCDYRFETVPKDTWDHEIRAYLIVGEDEIGSATGKNKQAAREAVCRQAVNILKKTAHTVKIKYDDFVVERKKVSNASDNDSCLTDNNIGYQMLKTLGWSGGGLGKPDNPGIEEPVKAVTKYFGSGHQGLGFSEIRQPAEISDDEVKEVIAHYASVESISVLIFLPGFKKSQKRTIERLAKKHHLHHSCIGPHSGIPCLVVSKYSSALELLNSLKMDEGHTSKYEVTPPTA